jgi:hypothetical protein
MLREQNDCRYQGDERNRQDRGADAPAPRREIAWMIAAGHLLGERRTTGPRFRAFQPGLPIPPKSPSSSAGRLRHHDRKITQMTSHGAVLRRHPMPAMRLLATESQSQ